MNDVDVVVPRLAKGSHHRNTGKMCAMNLVSWERGDWWITDYPADVAPALARMCHHLNDRVCSHGEVASDLLCATCSMGVIDVAHAMVGTAGESAELSWRWAAAVADLAADELGLEFPWVAAKLRRSGDSCRDIAREIRTAVPTSISVHTESRAAGQSASTSLGDVLGRVDAARTIRFAARAVAVWHELAASVPAVVDPEVPARAWVAAGAAADADRYWVNITFTPSSAAFPAPPIPHPVWLPAVSALSLVSTT